MAVGALRALADAGLRVPEDVAVVGFDDGPIAACVTPSLTTIRQPVRDLGWLATERLIERMRDPERPAEQRQLPVELVVRRSCGCGA
jgi:LacI family transcriptional regulator